MAIDPTTPNSTMSLEQKRELLARMLRERSDGARAEQPLSHGQRAFWFLHKLAPESWAFHVVFAARVCSPLDAPALERALEHLQRRHAVLRTTYPMRNDEPVQRVHDSPASRLDVVDVAGQSTPAIIDQLTEEAHRAFDLENGPILRCHLYRRSRDDHFLLLATHHIAIDGWSLWVCLHELRDLYAAELSGREASLSAVPLQYGDFVRWQNQLLSGPDGDRQWRFWRDRLGSNPPVLQLPTDHPRPAVQTYDGASLRFHLDAELTGKLKAAASERGATLYMLLLAAYLTLLHRYTGQTDIVVGTPASGRSKADFERLVGYLANPIAVRVDLSDDPSFEDCLARVREAALQAFDHQDYPFPLLVDRLLPTRDPSHSPLFQTVFVLQRPHLLSEDGIGRFVFGESDTRVNFGDLVLEPLQIPIQQEGQFELTLSMVDLGDRISGAFDYNVSLFERKSLARMARHLQMLLASIVDRPESTLSSLEMLDDAERRRVLRVESPSARVASSNDYCLHTLFETRAAESPDAVALGMHEHRLSYRELDERANRLANHLRNHGVGVETLVGLSMERSTDTVVAMLGILKSGGAYVPLDPRYPSERLEYLLEDSRVPVVVTESGLEEKLGDYRGVIVRMDADWPRIARESAVPPPADTRSDNAAYVIYTSGSTGKPKGVVVTHRNVSRLFSSTRDWYGFGPDDVWTLFHSYAFDFSVWEIWGALLHGGRLVVVPYEVSRSPLELLELIRAEGVTVLNQTPSAFRQLMPAEAQSPSAIETLRLVIFGGEALDVRMLEPWFARHGDACPRLVNMYGITETTVHVTYRPLAASDPRTVHESPIGVPIPDLCVHLLDRQLRPVPIGVVGELYVGGAGLARGYLNRPALTADRFVPDPYAVEPGQRLYRTGDLGRRLDDGSIEFLGRIDDQVKIRGFRIELGEIEAILADHPAVEDVVVLAREGESGERRLVAYLRRAPGDVSPGVDLRSFAQERLPEFMVPEAYVELDVIPLTENGKLDRDALPAPRLERTPPHADSAPRSTLEQEIVAIWQEVLKVESPAVGDNFFDIGGNSLLLALVQTKLRQSLGRSVSMLDLFRFPTIGALAAHLSADGPEVAPENAAPQRVESSRSGRERLAQRLARQRGESN